MRLKFFKRSEEKFLSRIDPESEAHRDLRVIFPGACPGIWVQGSALGFIPFDFLLILESIVNGDEKEIIRTGHLVNAGTEAPTYTGICNLPEEQHSCSQKFFP